MKWTIEAEKALEIVPAHVRDMARMGVEEYVRKENREEVSLQDVETVKAKYFSLIEKPEDKDKPRPVRVAVVRCDIVSEVCPGVGCLKAWNKKTVHFEGYDQDAELIGFFTCGGCSGRRVHRLTKKLKENYDVDVIHLSSCMLFDTAENPKCPFKQLIKGGIEGKGIKVIEGTHH